MEQIIMNYESSNEKNVNCKYCQKKRNIYISSEFCSAKCNFDFIKQIEQNNLQKKSSKNKGLM